MNEVSMENVPLQEVEKNANVRKEGNKNLQKNEG
jgi:hypothetical protein